MNSSDGGPAFPLARCVSKTNQVERHKQNGMSLRDWFAGMALRCMADAFGPPRDQCAQRRWAQSCYEIADAMLAERERAE